jgi:hypothetical protein
LAKRKKRTNHRLSKSQNEKKSCCFQIRVANFGFFFLDSLSLTRTEMAESNGELMEDSTNPKPEDRGDGERTDDYPKLLSYGLDKKVSDNISTVCGS